MKSNIHPQKNPAPSCPKMQNGVETTETGHTFYYKDYHYHREDGPAAIYSYDEQHWFYEGMLHRENGPAVIRFGIGYYFIHGVEYSEDEYKLIMFTQYGRAVNK